MTNKCDCRPMFYCTSTDADDCRYSDGKRHKSGACIYCADVGGVIVCTSRDARLAALILAKAKVMKP